VPDIDNTYMVKKNNTSHFCHNCLYGLINGKEDLPITCTNNSSKYYEQVLRLYSCCKDWEETNQAKVKEFKDVKIEGIPLDLMQEVQDLLSIVKSTGGSDLLQLRKDSLQLNQILNKFQDRVFEKNDDYYLFGVEVHKIITGKSVSKILKLVDELRLNYDEEGIDKKFQEKIVCKSCGGEFSKVDGVKYCPICSAKLYDDEWVDEDDVDWI